MASASDRARRIRQQATELRDAPPLDYDPESPLTAALSSATIPEIFAVVIAAARNEGVDEVERIEIMLRAFEPAVSQQELEGWGDLLGKLGYRKVSVMMKRLRRHAPSRPAMTILDKVKARQAARSAFKKQQN
ncbi:hypothetical protein IVB27_38525 [Bradyrhizobium sp. 197]|uniref:hypothetical protein n=1 Tax=Bradyrhizobium sp. 197 TaxID=2782663 RepID=UPI001FF973F9|nr:hypothetical protein [Bradyrhizobium sp. 197]MCK1480475.1 hypothetical protein [Bradyrhizobium sp. 197]